MQRTEREIGGTPPPIDIPSTVSGVIAGDQDAMGKLDGLLRNKLIRFFSRYNRQISEDLAQDTIMKVLTALPTFDSNLGEGNYEQNFWSWAFTIGRNSMIDNHRREARQGITTNVPIDEKIQYDDAREDGGEEWFYQIDDQTVLSLIKSRFPYLLTGREQKIIELRVAGRKNKEIAELLNTTEGVVKVRMTLARAKIENEILEKAGFKRSSAFGDKRFQEAVAVGRVRSIKILGRYYVREEDVNAYNKRKVQVDQELLDNGYLLLSECTTAHEYAVLTSSYSSNIHDAILKHNGRVYIKKEDLQILQEKIKNRRKARIFPPSPSHKKLTDLCRTIIQ